MPERWVASWTASPSGLLHLVEPSLRPALSLYDQTFRSIVTPHRGVATVRVTLTNRFRPLPIEFASVTIAKHADGRAIDPATLRAVTFGGRNFVQVAAGADVTSDPVTLPFAGFEPLAVSVHVPGLAMTPSGHLNANAPTYYGPPRSGCATAAVDGSSLRLSTTCLPFLCAVDVLAPQTVSTVVAFGDSITDGYVAANYGIVPQDRGVLERNVRYPDFLQRRIDAAKLPVAVVNAGISGNRLLRDGRLVGLGPAALTRLRSDVADVAGVSDAIVQIGTNDIALPPRPRPQQLIDGYRELVDTLHDAGIRVHLGTLLPAASSLSHGWLTPRGRSHRDQVNAWIRNQTIADSVVDFDAALRDPADPAVLAERYASPDRLHPNAAGYAAMADAIDVTALEPTAAGPP